MLAYKIICLTQIASQPASEILLNSLINEERLRLKTVSKSISELDMKREPNDLSCYKLYQNSLYFSTGSYRL